MAYAKTGKKKEVGIYLPSIKTLVAMQAAWLAQQIIKVQNDNGGVSMASFPSTWSEIRGNMMESGICFGEDNKPAESMFDTFRAQLVQNVLEGVEQYDSADKFDHCDGETREDIEAQIPDNWDDFRRYYGDIYASQVAVLISPDGTGGKAVALPGETVPSQTSEEIQAALTDTIKFMVQRFGGEVDVHCIDARDRDPEQASGKTPQEQIASIIKKHVGNVKGISDDDPINKGFL